MEQPFDIIPMNKMCMIVMWNLNETFVNLPRHVQRGWGCTWIESCVGPTHQGRSTTTA